MVDRAFLFDEDFVEYAKDALAGVSQVGQVSGRGSRPIYLPDNWTLAAPLRLFLSGEKAQQHWYAGPIYTVLDIELFHGGNPTAFVRELLAAHYDAVRAMLCDESGEPKRLPWTARTATASLATWLCATAGVSEPFGVAAAVVTVLVIAEATQGVFCRLSKEQILNKLRDRHYHWPGRDTEYSHADGVVFLSYSRKDAEIVDRIEKSLKAAGFNVFVDTSIQGGDDWRRSLVANLNSSRLVVVVWTENSISSTWVPQEAEEGLQRGILLPITLDGVRPPLGFRHIQHLSFSKAELCDSADALSSICSAVARRMHENAIPVGSL